jgi:hypothetical protein
MVKPRYYQHYDHFCFCLSDKLRKLNGKHGQAGKRSKKRICKSDRIIGADYFGMKTGPVNSNARGKNNLGMPKKYLFSSLPIFMQSKSSRGNFHLGANKHDIHIKNCG